MGRRGDEVEDARAAVALVQAVVAADLVEALRAQAHVARRAEPVARFRHREAAAAVRDAFEDHHRLARDLGHDRLARRAVLLQLAGSQGAEYRVGFTNFFAITRYNRSMLYASAVNDLAVAIAAASAPPAPVAAPAE